jgi:hypothetical protein
LADSHLEARLEDPLLASAVRDRPWRIRSRDEASRIDGS